MAQPFLITGLPRSRTAWMSVFCTTGASLCYHEPSPWMADLSEIRALYAQPSPKFIGISDSGLGFFLPWLMAEVKPRTLIIDRDLNEVNESIARMGLPTNNFCELLQTELLKFKEHPLVMWVPYAALDHDRTMERVLFHLLPGESFDSDRYRQLNKMRISVHDKEVARLINKGASAGVIYRRDISPRLKVNGS